MSDSGEEWWEKDIESFTIDVKKTEASKNVEPQETPVDKERLYKLMKGEPDSSSKKNTEKNEAKSVSSKKTKISFTKLTTISKMPALKAFSELNNVREEFLEALKANNINKTLMNTACLCLFLSFETPFEEHKYMLMKKLQEIGTFWPQLSKHLADTAVSQDFHKGMELIVTILMRFKDFPVKVLSSLKSIGHTQTKKSKNPAFWKTFLAFLNDPTHLDVLQETILPSTEDFLGENRKEIPQNIVKGAFPSALEYRKTHTALLKEDFLNPIRESLAIYVENYPEMAHEGLVENIFVIPRVQLGHDGEEGSKVREFVDLKFSENKQRKGTVMNSGRRFMPGTLLIFASDVTKLNDLILATVLPHDPTLKQKGIIPLTIVKCKAEHKIFDGQLTLIEPATFFEPYNHVFNVLSTMNDSNLPMKRQIVDVDIKTEVPSYFKKLKSTKINHKGADFDISDASSYPKGEIFGLDDSQMEAYKSALTRNFSLIQGPPGTGKTHIGLEIIKTLLRHTKEKVLVVCYTNHALDQTLSGLLQDTDQIVRFGDQSKNEQMQKFTFKQVGMNRDHLVDGALKQLQWKTKQERTAVSDKYHEIQVAEDVVKEETLKKVQLEMESVTKRLFELSQLQTFLRIQDKRVFGMTTTYAARCHSLLQLLEIPIVIFEEAAEILESHIVTSLTPKIEHLILIGDHFQLKPNTSDFRLSKEFHLNLSLFERMINNDFPHVQLKKQHRMRPCIAELIRDTIYPELVDAENVLDYPNVRNLSKNLFFHTHESRESSKTNEIFNETSKSNKFEAEYLINLCLFLVRTGTPSEDITILTMYQGQMRMLLEVKRKKDEQNLMEGVKITVVDNFQGEENKIILLSLVRSNEEGKIGFVGIRNRVCVALSRAKEGLYIVGNMKMLKEASGIWKKINEKLEKMEAIGGSNEAEKLYVH